MRTDRLRQYSPADRLIRRLDRVLRAATRTGLRQHRACPATSAEEPALAGPDRRHAAALMRVNHAGEVSAQALYVGQAIFARREETAAELERAAGEEGDHLFWCEQRLDELDGHVSRLNPLWFGGALGIGMLAALFGDRASMAFVEETERQVVRHLENHLDDLPAEDVRSREIVRAMRDDEARHAESAAARAAPMPAPVARLMALQARVMTTLAYRL